MRISTRYSVVAAIVLIAATTACGGDSTGPRGGGSTAGTLAQHFDTLSAQAKATSLSDTNYKFRALLLSDLELVAAFGATPTTIMVTTASGPEQWKGFVFEEVVNNNGTASDSAIFIVAYRDSLVHTALISVFLANGSSLGSSLLANDTLQIGATSHSGSASLTSTGTACATPIAGLVNPLIATAKRATCLSAVFNSTLALGFPATTGVSSALTAFSYPTTTFAGERFFDPVSAGAPLRIFSSLQRAMRAPHGADQVNGTAPSVP